jgi:hypothetical protein
MIIGDGYYSFADHGELARIGEKCRATLASFASAAR